MKILHVSSATTWRGGEAQAFYLARGLMKKGHEILFAAPEGSPLLVQCTAEGCAPIPIEIRSDSDLRSFWRFREIVRQHQPLIVHAHDAHAHTAAAFARKFGAPGKLVVSRRVSYAPRAHFFNKIKYGPNVDCFLAVSRHIGQQLLTFGVEPRRVVTVRSGIEVERFQRECDPIEWRRAHGLPLDKHLIGVVASLAPQKEQEVLIRAAYRLIKIRNDLHFVLVGEGNTRPLLEQLIAKLGLQQHVTITGFVEDVVPAYKALTVAVLPSSAGEGSPAAIKEAIACGIPVVAIDEPNVREILDHGEDGILVPPKNDEAMAQMLDMLLNDAELYGKITNNARAKLVQFDIRKMIDGTEEVYLRLVGAGREEDS